MIYSWSHVVALMSPHVTQPTPNGRWIAAVPLPPDFGRVRAAWAVLTGRAYAFQWPTLGEYELLEEWKRSN